MGQSSSKRAKPSNNNHTLTAKTSSFREKTNKAATMLTGRSRSSADVPSTLSTSSFDKSSVQSRSGQTKIDPGRPASLHETHSQGDASRVARTASNPHMRSGASQGSIHADPATLLMPPTGSKHQVNGSAKAAESDSHTANGQPDPLFTPVSGTVVLTANDVTLRQRRNTAPDMRRSSSLAHISDRAPLFTGSTVASYSGIFYTDFKEDVTAFEAAKTLRKTMKKYTKKPQYKTIEGKSSAGPGSIKSRLNALRPHVQSNSCSTLFVDQTVSQPDLDQILRCAATAIHMTFLWVLSEDELPPYDAIFDERLHPLTSHKVPPSYRTKCPRVTEIYDFLRAFFKAAVLKADVAIVTMVYIARLHNAGLVLQPGNWKRVVLGAVMMASKVWDDQAVWNADYCTVLPDVTVDSMNQLERTVLELLFYNVGVSCAEYAQHYFELRLYAHKADVEDGIKLSPLDVRRAKQLDAVNVLHQSDSGLGVKRVSSSDGFEAPMRHLIIS